MSLVSLVAIRLWQRSIIDIKKDNVQIIVDNWVQKYQAGEKKIFFTTFTLNDLATDLGPSCKNIILFDGDKVIPLNPEIDKSLMETVKTEWEGRTFAVSTGFIWNLFSFSKKNLHFVHQFENSIRENYSVIVQLDLQKIYKIPLSYPTIFIFYVLINSIVFSTIGFFRIAKYVLKPLDKLVTVADSHLMSSKLPYVDSKNEIAQLSFALNSMFSQITMDKDRLEKNVRELEVVNQQLVESQNMMVRAEKLAAIGRLSAGLAHEIGNPIGIVNGYLELLNDDSLTSEARKQYSERGLFELNRVEKMIRQLLDYSRNTTNNHDIICVSEVCKEALDTIRTQVSSQEITLEFDNSPKDTFVEIGGDSLYQVLLNCLFNSIDAIKERGQGVIGHVRINLNSLDQLDQDIEYVQIEISDDGIGIPEEELNAVFDPFFTTKDVGKGTGLGLSVSYAIIETAGGHIEIDSNYGTGTSVIIELPLYKKR